MSLTEDDLKAIRERCAKATPGPWHVHYDGTRQAETAHAYVTSQEEDTAHSLFDSMNRGYKESGITSEADEDGQRWYDERGFVDLEFCAKARTDVPALLDTIDQLTAETARLAAAMREAIRLDGGEPHDKCSEGCPLKPIALALAALKEPKA